MRARGGRGRREEGGSVCVGGAALRASPLGGAGQRGSRAAVEAPSRSARGQGPSRRRAAHAHWRHGRAAAWSRPRLPRPRGRRGIAQRLIALAGSRWRPQADACRALAGRNHRDRPRAAREQDQPWCGALARALGEGRSLRQASDQRAQKGKRRTGQRAAHASAPARGVWAPPCSTDTRVSMRAPEARRAAREGGPPRARRARGRRRRQAPVHVWPSRIGAGSVSGRAPVGHGFRGKPQLTISARRLSISSVRRRRRASATDTLSLAAASGLIVSSPSAGPESGPVEKNDESADAMATAVAQDSAAAVGGLP